MRTPLLGALCMGLLMASTMEACQLSCKDRTCVASKTDLKDQCGNFSTKQTREDIEMLTFQSEASVTFPGTVLKVFPTLRIINATGANLSSVAMFETNESNVLETLILSANRIHDLTATPFFQLTHLHYLALSNNSFTSFACENLAGLFNMVIMDLSHNTYMTYFKCHFMYVPSLKQLMLNNNKLVKITFTISHSRLVNLYLQDNLMESLSFLTDTDGKHFAHLQALNVSNNPLKNQTIPKSLQLTCLHLDKVTVTNRTECPRLVPRLELPLNPFITIEESVFLLLVAFCLLSNVVIMVLVAVWCQKMRSAQVPQEYETIECSEAGAIQPEAVTKLNGIVEQGDDADNLYSEI